MADSFKVMLMLWSGLSAVIAITCDCEFYAVFSEYKAKSWIQSEFQLYSKRLFINGAQLSQLAQALDLPLTGNNTDCDLLMVEG